MVKSFKISGAYFRRKYDIPLLQHEENNKEYLAFFWTGFGSAVVGG